MGIEELDISTHVGKRLRGELLIRLKDTAGLKYIDIIEIPLFNNLKLPSLGKLYRDAKVYMQNNRIDGSYE
jgi:hypothetical protein